MSKLAANWFYEEFSRKISVARPRNSLNKIKTTSHRKLLAPSPPLKMCAKMDEVSYKLFCTNTKASWHQHEKGSVMVKKMSKAYGIFFSLDTRAYATSLLIFFLLLVHSLPARLNMSNVSRHLKSLLGVLTRLSPTAVHVYVSSLYKIIRGSHIRTSSNRKYSWRDNLN